MCRQGEREGGREGGREGEDWLIEGKCEDIRVDQCRQAPNSKCYTQ
jgi:hypothetical protein